VTPCSLTENLLLSVFYAECNLLYSPTRLPGDTSLKAIIFIAIAVKSLVLAGYLMQN
jgi:hypothetical protein